VCMLVKLDLKTESKLEKDAYGVVWKTYPFNLASGSPMDLRRRMVRSRQYHRSHF
jgi:hypothetical protein